MNTNIIDNKLKSFVDGACPQTPGIGLIVFKAGEIFYEGYAGVCSLDNRPDNLVTRDTKFRVASVSKMFTAFAALQLVEEGKIDLNADSGEYLGFALHSPHAPATKITVKMLLNHTSSLRDGKIYSIPPAFGVQEFFSPAGKFWENGAHFAPPHEKPGEYFCYCNLNYGLLGTIIENVTRTRFDIRQKNHILRELGTAADYLPGNLPSVDFARLGVLYQRKNPAGEWDACGQWFAKIDDYGGKQPPPDTVVLQNPYDDGREETYSLENYRVGTNATFFSPQGGLRISFAELTSTAKMLLGDGKQILSRPSRELMFSPHWQYDAAKPNGDTCGGSLTAYGLGAEIHRCKIGASDYFIGHLGMAFGMLSGLFVCPATKDGFLFMANGEPRNEDDAIGNVNPEQPTREKLILALVREILS